MSFVFTTNIFDIVKGFLAIALLILAVVFIPKFNDKLDNIGKPLDATTIEHIVTNIVRVNLAENKKDFKEFLKELKKDNSLAIKAAIEDNITIKELGDFMATMKGKTDPDPGLIETPSGDPDGARDLEEFIIKRDDSDGKSFPTGIVRHSPNVKEGPKFSYQQFPLDFNATIVSGDKGQEEKRYVEVWVESNFVKDSRGVKHPIEIKNVRWEKLPLGEKGFMWNPRLSFTGVMSSESAFPALGVSLLSYGRTNRDMDWTFLNFSVGGDSDNFYGVSTPFSYNLGNSLPMVENMFIGPTIGYGSEQNFSYGLGVSVPF